MISLDSLKDELQTDFGAKLSGSPNDTSLNRIMFYSGVFEPSLSDFMSKVIRPGDICVDVGANTGYFTLLMAKLVGSNGKVIAIEASPKNVRLLQDNIDLNHFSSRTLVTNSACSDQQGFVDFYVHPKNDMLCRLELPTKKEMDYWFVGKKWDKVTVQAETLKALIGEDCANVTFLKLDIEGAEYKTSQEVLRHFTHPNFCIALEAKQPRIRETLKPYEDAGFYVYDLQNDYKWLFDNKHRRIKKTSFEELYKKGWMVDVIMSRRDIQLDRPASQQSDTSRRTLS